MLQSHAGWLGLVQSLSKLLDHLSIECWDVVRLAARHQSFVGYHLAVDPFATSISDIRTQRGPRSQSPSRYDYRLNEHPRRVADCRDRLPSVKKAAHELHSAFALPQTVWIHHASRKQQSIKVVRSHAIERLIHQNVIAPLTVLPTLDFSGLGRHDHRARSCLVERFPRFEELNSLTAVSREHRDSFSQ